MNAKVTSTSEHCILEPEAGSVDAGCVQQLPYAPWMQMYGLTSLARGLAPSVHSDC